MGSFEEVRKTSEELNGRKKRHIGVRSTLMIVRVEMWGAAMTIVHSRMFSQVASVIPLRRCLSQRECHLKRSHGETGKKQHNSGVEAHW